MNIAQEVHLYFWFTQLFYFPNQREAKGCICICFNNRSVGISGFWRIIITLLVKDFFFFFWFEVEMRYEKEREWCVGSSLEMGTGIYKVLLHIWWNNCYNHIFACCFFKVYFSYKWRPFIFHHCQIILYTALQRRIYWVAF